MCRTQIISSTYLHMENNTKTFFKKFGHRSIIDFILSAFPISFLPFVR